MVTGKKPRRKEKAGKLEAKLEIGMMKSVFGQTWLYSPFFGGGDSGQAARLISTSQLNASLRLHPWPIEVVVYNLPSDYC